jgi:hypothetical protein
MLQSLNTIQPTTEYLPLSREVEGDGPMKPGNPSPDGLAAGNSRC